MLNLEAIPTWALTRLIIWSERLPAGHPWAGKRFTLTDWQEHRTQICRAFDQMLWLNAMALMYLFVFCL